MREGVIMPPLPDGFREEMQSQTGEYAEDLLVALDSQPETGIRLNPRKQPRDADAQPSAFVEAMSQAAPVEWCAEGYRLGSRPIFTLMPELHAGAFYVQDPSSMITRPVVQKLVEIIRRQLGDPSACPSLLDLCAAPGGKTTAAIDGLPDGSPVIANEYESSRLGALRTNLMRWGYPYVAVTQTSAVEYSRMPDAFDIVMADAPCSGEGMMRKEPEARRQWSPGLVRQCAALQRDILDAAVATLKPGGYLIYSTCTFNRAENECQLDYLADTYGMEPMTIDLSYAAIAGMPVRAFGDVAGMRFMPNVTRGEGLFMSVLKKPGHLVSDVSCRASARKGKTKPPKDSDKAAGLLKNPDEYAISAVGDVLSAVPEVIAPLLARLPKKVRVVASGVEIGMIRGKDFIPSPELGLSMAYNRGVMPEVEVDEATALNYLRRQPLILQPEVPKGMVLITYRGLPLGWVKNIGSRANNLYPKELGIKFL